MNRERGFSLQDTEYPAVRRVMGHERDRLDDDALERVLTDLFPGAMPEEVEDFMRSLQSFGRQVAPIAQRALPGVAQGAAQGAMVAGPWGALAGAIGGGAASLLSGGGSRPAARPGAAPAPGPPPAPLPGPAVAPPGPIEPPAGTAPGAAAPTPAAAATAQLVTLLSRPETMQALLALLMSGAGRSTVQVGRRDVPAAAFANAIAETAALVAEAAGHPLEQSVSEFLFDSLGQPRGDVVNPSERAALLLSDLAAVAAEEALEDEDAEDESWGADPYGLAEDGDPLDGYEDALMGMAGDEY